MMVWFISMITALISPLKTVEEKEKKGEGEEGKSYTY